MICQNCIHSEVCKHKRSAVYECEHFKDGTIKNQYDRIRNMSIDEMAIFRNNTSLCAMCIFDYARDCSQEQQDCYIGVKQWLESEVTE